MQTIKTLIADKFSLVNVNDEKRPLAGKGWNLKSYAELVATHKPDSTKWGIKLGKHENERRLLCFDFDVYGSTHPETPCPIAEKEYNYYCEMSGVGSPDNCADGLFTGSTVGNAGLVIDYTDNQLICEGIDLLNSYGIGKSSVGEIEVFWGDEKMIVLPPTATLCKRNKKVVQPRKYFNEQPLAVIDNSTPDECWRVKWITDQLRTVCLAVQKEKGLLKPVNSANPLTPPTSRASSPTLRVGGAEDKWVDLIMNVIKNPKNDNGIGHKVIRDDFIKICGALKSNGYDPQVWRDWVALDRNHGDGMRTWDNLTTERLTPMGCLKSVAFKIAPDELIVWKRKWKDFLPHKTLMKGENDIAKFLEFHLAPYMRCFKKLWWLYDERTCLWAKTDTPTAYIITTLQQIIDEACAILGGLKAFVTDENKKTEIQKKIEDYLAYRRSCCGSKVYSALKEYLKTYLAVDKEWCERFDNIPYKIPYKNGLYCLRTNTFRVGILPTDYLTHTLPYNYEPAVEEDKVWLREQLKKICNFNETHLERFLSEFGYMLCGDPSLIQEFYNFKGEKAGNGKSSILDALTEILPNLVKKLDSNVFEKSAKGTLHKTTATLSGVRIAWLNEVDASAVQDESTLKTWTDGMTISYNEMYGVNMSIKITFKLVVVGNNGIKVKGDNGVMRRMAINQFDSEFTEDATEDDFENCIFVRDTEFPKKLIEKKHSLLALFYDYSKKFCDDGGKMKPMPKEWIDEKAQIRENLAKFDKWFDIHYEWKEGREDWEAWIDDIEAHAKLDKMRIEDIKTELKRMKLWKNPIVYDSQARVCKKKGVFRNLRARDEPHPSYGEED